MLIAIVSSILNSDGVEVSACADIKLAYVDFYTRLFSEDPIDQECKQPYLAFF